jgi:hypothetical protein
MRLGRLVSAVAMTGLLIAGLSAPLAGHAAPGTHRNVKLAAALKANKHDFIVISVAGNTAPTTMVVARGPYSAEITVAVSSTTTIVRRFDGKSDLSEVSPGDQVQIKGVRTTAGGVAATNAATVTGITATAIKDVSIQVGFTQINGRVLYISRALDQLVVRVTANEGRYAAFERGAIATIDVTPATKFALLNNPNATTADVRPGMVLTGWGLSNRDSHIMFSPHDLTQLLPRAAAALAHAGQADTTAK